jgi:CRP/FNR family transcriptional regulator, anaerobic regulatory protein
MMIKTVTCKSCKTANCYIKNFCSESWLKKIDEAKLQLTYRKKQNIIHEGEPVSGIHFIQNGKVKIYFTGLNDNYQIVRFAQNGHIIGHKGNGAADFYPFSAAAMEDSVTCYIKNRTLDDLFHYNPEIVTNLMKFYSRELRKAEERIKNLSQMNVREKVADVLLTIYNDFGLNEQNELQLSFTRQDIASLAGTSGPQVAVHLGDFETEKLIQRHGNRIIILSNIPGLKKIISKYNLHRITI